MNERLFQVSTFVNKYSPRVATSFSLTWTGLTSFLSVFRQFTSKDGCPQWSAARFDPGWRKNANVVSLSCLVFDFDDGERISTVLDRADPWSRLVYTTWRHTQEHHRFRLVLPLLTDVEPDEYRILWQFMNERLGGGCDTACKDLSRAWLMPAYRPGFTSFTIGGRLFSSNSVPQDFRQRVAVSRPVPLENRLDHLPQDMRDLILQRLGPTLGLPAQRAALASRVGAVVGKDHARGGLCPQCGRQSVWWHLRPLYDYRAQCSHRNSCGWRGPLTDVALGADACVDDLQTLD